MLLLNTKLIGVRLFNIVLRLSDFVSKKILKCRTAASKPKSCPLKIFLGIQRCPFLELLPTSFRKIFNTLCRNASIKKILNNCVAISITGQNMT